MSVSGGYSKYADDRNPSVIEMIADGDTEAKKKWHQVKRVDANQVTREYLFEQVNFDEFEELMERQDQEFKSWMAGVMPIEGGE